MPIDKSAYRAGTFIAGAALPAVSVSPAVDSRPVVYGELPRGAPEPTSLKEIGNRLKTATERLAVIRSTLRASAK